MLATLGKLLVPIFRVLLLPLRMFAWLEEAITGQRRRLQEERNSVEQRPPLTDEAFAAQAGITAGQTPVAVAIRKALARACRLPETAFYPDDTPSLLGRLMTPGPDAHWADVGPDWLSVLVDMAEPLGLRSSRDGLQALFDRWLQAERSEGFRLRHLVPLLSDSVRDVRARRLPRVGQVSLWGGRFAGADEAESYFAEASGGEYPGSSTFSRQWGLGSYSPGCLEFHFEQTADRPLEVLLEEATFSASFIDAALESAGRQGICEAQGIALVYDLEYQLSPARPGEVGPMRFIGSFAFDRGALPAKFHRLAEKAGCSITAVLFVLAAFGECRRSHYVEQGVAGHISAAEFCEYLVSAGMKDTAAVLRCLPSKHAAELSARETPAGVLRRLGLRRSEDVGRVVFGLVNAGVLTRQESDSEADFQGQFVLE
jgi:hypothetical protein